MNLGVSFVSGSRQRRCVTCGGWVCQPTCVARCGKWPLATSSTSHMVTFQLYSLLLVNCCCLLSKLFVTVGSCVHLFFCCQSCLWLWGVVFVYSFVAKVVCDCGELCSVVLLLSKLLVTVGSCVQLFICCQSCLWLWGVVFSCSFVVKVACDCGELCSVVLLLSKLLVTVGSCVQLFFCCQSCLWLWGVVFI